MLRRHLEDMHTALKELESHARKLPNQNFADIVKSAHGKVHQLVHHPDIDVVHKQITGATDHEARAHGSDGSAVHEESAQSVPGKADVRQGGTPFPS